MISRPKNRYILVESTAPLDTRSEAVANEIIRLLSVEIGALGYVRSHPKIVCQVGSSRFIVRVGRGWEKEIMLALSFMKEMGGMPIGFFTLKTSGSVKKLKTVPNYTSV